jgi:hypothetical protein
MGGSFFKPEDLCIGNSYKLTEFVEDKEVSSGDYFLVSVMPSKKERYPTLGFSTSQSREADVFLVQAHAQFGDPTWRRAFMQGNRWEVYCPAGARTWNHSWVEVRNI